ncbi:hypothetical protein Tco_0316645, partial [Tanacetum coccineum]
MALPVQNINHSAFKSMFEREKLSGNNFNDWFRQLKLVLRVEKKMFVIEQPIPPAPTADSAANELKSMFEKQVGVERFDLIQTFHACKQEEGKPVAEYVLKMKGYLDQLERLGYVLPQDLSVGLILNGLTRDFVGFVRNYNMHNMGKTIDELHAMLIEYEKGLVLVGHWKRNCPVYLVELLKKKKKVGSASSSDTLLAYLRTNGDDSHASGTGVRGNEHAARECTYLDFLKCKPLNFKGTEGVVLKDAIEFATELMDKKISTFAELKESLGVGSSGPETVGVLLTTNTENNSRATDVGIKGHYKSDCPELRMEKVDVLRNRGLCLPLSRRDEPNQDL